MNVDTEKLFAKALKPGKWLQRLRGPLAAPGETVEVNGVPHPLGTLQAELIVTTPGDSIAYLTDFRMTPGTSDMLADVLRGVNTVVCESQYSSADANLADAVMHSTAAEVAMMAAKAQIGRLILFHFSDRYDAFARAEIVQEARPLFANTSMPDGWV